MKEDRLTQGQAARAAEISEATLNYWRRKGWLPAEDTPLGWLYRRADVLALAAERREAVLERRARKGRKA